MPKVSFKDMASKELRFAWECFKFYGETGYFADGPNPCRDYYEQNKDDPDVLAKLEKELLYALAEEFETYFDAVIERGYI